jgi:hypothetical protein
VAASSPLDVPVEFLQALGQVRDAQYSRTLATIQELERKFPEHPLTHLITAETYWELIYCQTGHITAEEVWNLADQKTSSFDSQFFAAVDRALNSSRRMLVNPETKATGLFYSGIARGLRGQLYSLRKQTSKSASEGKQMRADLMEAVSRDSLLAPDAYLGLGSYNYYVDVLSPLLKIFRFLLRIPGGDRRNGLEQLRMASQRATLFAPEAQYELARILGVREELHSESMALFRDLSGRYPGNALLWLSAAYQAEQAGQQERSLQFLEGAMEATAKMDGACQIRLAGVARGALQRVRR